MPGFQNGHQAIPLNNSFPVSGTGGRVVGNSLIALTDPTIRPPAPKSRLRNPIEALRLQSATRLENAIAVYLIIAWRLHMLTMLARELPDVPCDTVLSEQEWQTAYIMHKGKPPPKQPPMLREATRMLACLGGFLGRKGDGEPGTKTIWIGYTNLLAYIKAINQVAALR